MLDNARPLWQIALLLRFSRRLAIHSIFAYRPSFDHNF